MKTSNIITEIDKNFASTYRGAATFMNSGSLWNFCIRTIQNPIFMGNITFANDLGIPPVKALLTIYRREMKPAITFQFTAQESRCIGALMGYVFRFVFGYQKQKERCVVNEFGIKTASRFLNGPVIEFE